MKNSWVYSKGAAFSPTQPVSPMRLCAHHGQRSFTDASQVENTYVCKKWPSFNVSCSQFSCVCGVHGFCMLVVAHVLVEALGWCQGSSLFLPVDWTQN